MGNTENNNVALTAPAILPDGNGGFTPCPSLLTEAEVVRFLRLDLEDTGSEPTQTLKHYRDRGQLIAIRVGRNNRYRRQDVEDFLKKKSEEKQRRSAQ
jgi:hypothetical protein